MDWDLTISLAWIQLWIQLVWGIPLLLWDACLNSSLLHVILSIISIQLAPTRLWLIIISRVPASSRNVINCAGWIRDCSHPWIQSRPESSIVHFWWDVRATHYFVKVILIRWAVCAIFIDFDLFKVGMRFSFQWRFWANCRESNWLLSWRVLKECFVGRRVRKEILEQALVKDFQIGDLEHPCHATEKYVQALLFTVQIFVEQDEQPDLMLRYKLSTVIVKNLKELLRQIFSYDSFFAFAFFFVLLDLLWDLYEVVCVA